MNQRGNSSFIYSRFSEAQKRPSITKNREAANNASPAGEPPKIDTQHTLLLPIKRNNDLVGARSGYVHLTNTFGSFSSFFHSLYW